VFIVLWYLKYISRLTEVFLISVPLLKESLPAIYTCFFRFRS